MTEENKEVLPEEEMGNEIAEEQNSEEVANNEDAVETQAADSEAAEEPQQNKDTINWKNLREEKEKAQRERDEAVALLRQIERQALSYQSEQKKAKEAPSNEFDDLEADDYIPRSYVDKKYRELKKEVEEYKKSNYEKTVESQMKSQFSDFDEIVSHDNIKKLKEAYPEIASSIASNSDLGSRAKAAYTAIKKLGISSDGKFDSGKGQVASNVSKPRSSASLSPQKSDSPLSKANAFSSGLTDEIRTKLYREMIEARNKS